MKKKLLISTSLLAISLGVFASVGTGSNKEIIKTKADSSAYDLYVQVTDTTELDFGDTVLIACGDHAIGGLGGNPCFTYGNTVSGGNNDKTKFCVASTNAIKLKVVAGFNGYGSYAFQSLRTAAEESDHWLKTHDRYLSYANPIYIDGHAYGYHYDNINIQTKGDIIFKPVLDEYSSWNLDFDSEGYVYMSRYNETNRYGAEGITNPISMQWNNAYTQGGYFSYSFGGSSMRILRKIDVSNPSYYSNNWFPHAPSKNHYEPNETAVLDGLVIEFSYHNPVTTQSQIFRVSYDNEYNFFTLGKANYDTQRVYFQWCGVELDYPVKVDVDKTGEHYYNQLTTYTTPSDIRGSYLLGVEDSNELKVMKLSGIPTSEDDAKALPVETLPAITLSENKDVICDKNDLNEFVSEVTDNIFKIVYDTDGFYVKYGSSYLCRHDTGHTYYLLYLGNKESSFKVRVGLNGTLMTPENDIFIYDHSYGSSGIYLNKNNHVNSNESEMVVFKKEFSTDEGDQLENYRISFFNNTNACRSDGSTVLEDINWTLLANTFNYSLSVDSQGYLANLTYDHNAEESGSLRDLADRYDYIVSKYTTSVFPDFMHRIEANTLQNNYQSLSNYNELSDMNNNSMFVIVSIATFSTLFVLFIIARKRRHQ